MNKEFTNSHADTGARRRTHVQRVLNVLIACEESQAECTAFRNLGHNAYSCDIQLCRKGGNPRWHIHDDASPYIGGKTNFTTQDGVGHWLSHWDLIICHPPCTYLCRLSSCQLYREPTTACTIDGYSIIANWDRVEGMKAGRTFFLECLQAKANYVAVENPVPMKLANLPKPSFFADPSWFGTKYTKKTCYWVKGLPPLMPYIQYPNPKCYVHCSRGKYRSRTFPELAQAIAKQWSEYILNDMSKSDLQVQKKTIKNQF